MARACENCGERESLDDGALCSECRTEMWQGVCEHQGNVPDDLRTVEDRHRANGVL